MFGFLFSLTLMNPKRYGYQNLHLLCLIYVWALTKRERIGVLVMDACGVRWTYLFDASLSKKHGGRTTSCLEKWIGYTVLVTISSSSFWFYLKCLYASVSNLDSITCCFVLIVELNGCLTMHIFLKNFSIDLLAYSLFMFCMLLCLYHVDMQILLKLVLYMYNFFELHALHAPFLYVLTICLIVHCMS